MKKIHGLGIIVLLLGIYFCYSRWQRTTPQPGSVVAVPVPPVSQEPGALPAGLPVAVTAAPPVLKNTAAISVTPDAAVVPKPTNTLDADLRNQAADRAIADPQGPLVPESMARAALDDVGADPVAEQVWLEAINDPRMPDDARQNLIEDLNENGLEDPKHPTPDDLPLIESRLALIEEVAPDAMDQVNADAFQEAYKDLLKMQTSLLGR